MTDQLEALKGLIATAALEAVRVVTPAIMPELIRAEVSKIPKAENGTDGRDGSDGKDGRDGVDGKDGEPGHFDCPVAYTSGVLYPAKSIVTHRGGSWYNWRDTALEPSTSDDWILVADAVHGVDVEPCDPTSLELVVTYASGKTERHIKQLAGLNYRGIFNDAETYGPGDLVTHGGSMWFKEQNATGKPGDDGAGWRLAVKRGKDGKDGKHGRDGVNGKDGAPGKDGKDALIPLEVQRLLAAADGAIRWAGQYVRGRTYNRNDLVGLGATVWIALRTTREAPPSHLIKNRDQNWELFIAAPVASGGGSGSDVTLPIQISDVNGLQDILNSLGGSSGAGTFIHLQGTPSTLWTVTHNLARFPAIATVDSTGRRVFGCETYLNGNVLQIEFGAPFSGTAYLN